MPSDKTSELVHAYYASWTDGPSAFDAARLRSLIAPDLQFEGPIAGKRTGVESFLNGLSDFVRTLSAYRSIQQVHSGNEDSALYDCDIGAEQGTLRFAEFVRIENEQIQEIKLVYDAHEFKRLLAPASADG